MFNLRFGVQEGRLSSISRCSSTAHAPNIEGSESRPAAINQNPFHSVDLATYDQCASDRQWLSITMTAPILANLQRLYPLPQIDEVRHVRPSPACLPLILFCCLSALLRLSSSAELDLLVTGLPARVLTGPLTRPPDSTAPRCPSRVRPLRVHHLPDGLSPRPWTHRRGCRTSPPR